MSAYVWSHRIVDYTYPELVAVQRATRSRRDALIRERTAVEERIIRGSHDGELMGLEKARSQLGGEIDALESAVRKQWDAIMNRGQPP